MMLTHLAVLDYIISIIL